MPEKIKGRIEAVLQTPLTWEKSELAKALQDPGQLVVLDELGQVWICGQSIEEFNNKLDLEHIAYIATQAGYEALAKDSYADRVPHVTVPEDTILMARKDNILFDPMNPDSWPQVGFQIDDLIQIYAFPTQNSFVSPDLQEQMENIILQLIYTRHGKTKFYRGKVTVTKDQVLGDDIHKGVMSVMPDGHDVYVVNTGCIYSLANKHHLRQRKPTDVYGLLLDATHPTAMHGFHASKGSIIAVRSCDDSITKTVCKSLRALVLPTSYRNNGTDPTVATPTISPS